MDDRLIADNIAVDQNRLLFAGQDVAALADRYGTPLYLMDEDRIRAQCRTYRSAMQAAFGARSRVLYASKAAAFKQMFRILRDEGLSADVVSSGELYTAQKAGFPMENVWFHSSNKTDADIAFAITSGVGCFVVDNTEELLAIDRIAAESGVRQSILLRLTPGIDPHTFAAVATGLVDSKFGFGIETGFAEEAVRMALSLQHVQLLGFHCHVGSQVFDADVFLRSADVMLTFMDAMRARYGYVADVLDLGGGYGVRYLPSDPVLNLAESILEIGRFVTALCQKLRYPLPDIALEPGRSIVADAGMTDNIRYALYGAPYTVLPVTRMKEPSTMLCSVVGRCCESGDIIQPDVYLPDTMQRGDRLAVCTTGAYHYSMASNYNRIPRPPIVMLKNGESYIAVKRESLDDLICNDL